MSTYFQVCFVELFKNIQMLLDQHDFLVVGVLGAQGVGKSTIMSALAADGRTKYVVVYAR